MSQNISWLGNDYENVTYTALPKTGGGEATFYDVSDTTAMASDVLDTAYFYTAQGVRTKGTNSGSPNLQDKTNISPSTSSQTIRADSGYDGLSSVQINAMPTQTLPTSTSSSGTGTTKATVSRSTSDQYINIPTGYNSTAVNYKISAVANGSAGTPTATKGTVSNHAITVTPSVTNTTGYITGGTKTGTGVSVSASEVCSGSETKTENGTYDVTNLAQVVVNVSGGSSKNVQVLQSTTRVNASSLTKACGDLTVSKTGTYDIYWSGGRSNTSTSYTWGTRLYIDGSGHGTENTSWTNNVQSNHLTNVSLTQNQKLSVYARGRTGSYYTFVPMLVIVES